MKRVQGKLHAMHLLCAENDDDNTKNDEASRAPHEMHAIIDHIMMMQHTIMELSARLNRYTRLSLMFIFFQSFLSIIFNAYNLVMYLLKWFSNVSVKFKLYEAMLFYGYQISASLIEVVATAGGFALIHLSMERTPQLLYALTIFTTEESMKCKVVNEVCETVEETDRTNRRWWVRPVNATRDEEGFFRLCVYQLKTKDEEHFYKATRMSVANFNVLLSLLKERLTRYSHRKPIDPETRLSVTLFYLAQGCNAHVLAWAFKLGISTVRQIVYETIWEELHCVYVAPPNQSEMKSISDQFYVKTGMPNCIGAIDGKHIHITRPNKSGSLYFNYKKSFSIVLLEACDANYVFTYVDVGAMGSQSDGVFAKSQFGTKLLNGSLGVPSDAHLPGTTTQFPYYFVGDSAFPLKKNLRPFPGHNLPEDKEKFNVALSKARVHIEHSFGTLANRWRILHTNIHAAPKNVDKIVLSTVVLHNFLMLQHDRNYFNIDLVSSNDNNLSGALGSEIIPLGTFRPRSVNRSSSVAFNLRDTLK